MNKGNYGTSISTGLAYSDAVAATREALRTEGFGVITEIDVKATMQEKLGIEYPGYVILGACNPRLAHRALTEEKELGLLLPCNVIVYETPDGAVVSALDPALMSEVTDNPALGDIATEAASALERVLEALSD